MTRPYTIFGLACLAVYIAGFSHARANSVTINLDSANLYDSIGTSTGNRVPPGTLCILVADWDGDGFDPADGDWVSGDDRLITVFDSEFPLASGGTKGFDLASGSTDAGFFSRTLGIELSQFLGRSTPLRIALRWFPGISAAGVNLTTSKPKAGAPYGEFFRNSPIYLGTIGWSLAMSAGSIWTLDPLVTAEAGGLDPTVSGMALWRVLQGGRAMEPRLELTSTGFAKLSFRGAPSTYYSVQRSLDLITWVPYAVPMTDSFGACAWVDPSPLLDRAFYRVSGPVAGP